MLKTLGNEARGSLAPSSRRESPCYKAGLLKKNAASSPAESGGLIRSRALDGTRSLNAPDRTVLMRDTRT